MTKSSLSLRLQNVCCLLLMVRFEKLKQFSELESDLKDPTLRQNQFQLLKKDFRTMSQKQFHFLKARLQNHVDIVRSSLKR